MEEVCQTTHLLVYQDMRPSRERVDFDPSKYPVAFRSVMAAFHREISNHHGTAGKVTNRGYTVEMEYSFPAARDGEQSAQEADISVLNLSHDKGQRFTRHHFTGAAAKLTRFETLRQATDAVARAHSICKSNTSNLTRNGVDSNEMISRIREALEELNCTAIETKDVEYGIKFTGHCAGAGFRFGIHFRKDEDSKRKKGGKPKVVWEILHPRVKEAVDAVELIEGFGQLNIYPNI